MWLIALLSAAHAAEPIAPPPPISANRTWDILDGERGLPDLLRQGALALGDWEIEVAGVPFDGARLLRMMAQAEAHDEPLLRAIREDFGRPVDLEDFIYLLDDVLVAGETRRGERFFLGTGRARSAGVLIHPDDVFKGKPRVYPHGDQVAVDEPQPQQTYPAAVDGEGPSPNWTMRYRNPTEPAEMYETLARTRPDATLASRIASLASQLEQQGAEVYLTSFLRYRERGYLMWGAHTLRRCRSESCVTKAIAELDEAKDWAPVDIVWAHPEGWEATREHARRMADAFDVVYATKRGARSSKHYDGVAADFVAINLPRTLELHAPDGARRTFDLSDPEHPRDLSLAPILIDWVEAHFGLRKLNSDYPHWADAAD